MKTAIVCDWLTVYAGAERVLHEIIRCFPSADLFAVVDFLSEADRVFLQQKPVATTFIQRLPFAKKYYRHYLPLMPLAIEQLDLSGYDVVISCSHAVAHGVLTGPDQLHISYVHTPMRYAWDLQNEYLRESGLEKGLKGYMTKRLLHRLRVWDQSSALRADRLIANSHFIARRIKKTWGREADVIYPPVSTAAFTPVINKENFYLAASRLVPYKRIDLIVESFAGMPDKKLVVIGQGPEYERIRRKAADNVTLMGYQPTAVLADYLARAKAFIFAAAEDFGILPVEAQACATPVIAFAKGGALETVCGLEDENPTGVFFHEQTVDAIQNAVKKFEDVRGMFTSESFRRQVEKFSPEIFRRKMIEFIEASHVR